jgi:hypothetical protein
MKCIFVCIFNQEKYVEMFYLLLESLLIYGKLDNSVSILIYTSTPFMTLIKKHNLYSDKIIFEINDGYDTIVAACKSRLDLFSLQSIQAFDKILYLDIDILIKDDINKVFNICKDDVLYTLEEGTLTDNDGSHGGKTLFGNELIQYKDATAFTSGILLFNNCEKIKELFNKIKEDIINRPHNFSCYHQPYIVYNAFKYNLYNNKLLKTVAANNDYNINSDKVIHHFPGGPGTYKDKIVYMTNFLHRMNKSNFIGGMKVYDVCTPPTKNIYFSLVGICVSYNYFDTLQFMLPVNYAHFEKLYLITQEDDLETIEFCKKFDNVKVLFYNFKNNNKTFDKFGAINYAQQIMYDEYPDSWYLIIDSDIILPNNCIDILSKETLNEECIYGAIRNNVLKSSELLNKKNIVNAKGSLTFISNNILHWKIKPPSILGCFQLYKKKCFHLNADKLDNASFGDYYFGHDNFNLFCNLENLLYFHLGEGHKNWYGKVVSFIDDCKLSCTNIYYNCHKQCNNVYYNKARNIVKGYNGDVNKKNNNIIRVNKFDKNMIFHRKHTNYKNHTSAVNHVNTHFTLSHILSHSKLNRRATNIKHNK